MKKTQGGFTLIELIVVIVLLGILGVTALARFQDLSGDAAQAALDGVASEITGSANIAYAKGLIGNTTVCIGSGAAAGVGNCAAGATVIDTSVPESCPAAVLTILQSVPATINGNALAVTSDPNDRCTAAGDTYTCTITAGAASSTANMICTQ